MFKFHVYELTWRFYIYILSVFFTYLVIFNYYSNILILLVPLELYFNSILNIFTFPIKFSFIISFFVNVPFLIFSLVSFFKEIIKEKDWNWLKVSCYISTFLYFLYLYLLFKFNNLLINYLSADNNISQTTILYQTEKFLFYLFFILTSLLLFSYTIGLNITKRLFSNKLLIYTMFSSFVMCFTGDVFLFIIFSIYFILLLEIGQIAHIFLQKIRKGFVT